MTRLFATVGMLALAVPAAAGEPSASTPSQLVQQLGSDDYREREAAVAALTRAGPGATAALREAAKSDDPEVRQRAAAILLKLQRAETSRERLAAKTVRLDYKDVPLGTAFADLRKRTGLNLALDPARLGDPLRKVTCSTGEVTVWEALDAFCAAAGLREEFRDELEPPKRPHPLGGGYGGYVVPPPVGIDAVPVTLIAGKPLRVVGDRRTAVRVLVLPPSFPGHRVTLGTGETTLCLDITPAPGLNWQEVSAVKISRVIDDEGRSGRAANPKASSPAVEYMDWAGPVGGRVIVFGGPGMGGQFGGQLGGQFGGLTQPRALPNPRVHPVPLKLATPHARSLRRLEGSVFGEITLPNQTLITVSEPEKNLGVAFDGPGDVRLTVVSLNKTEAGAKAQLLLEYPSAWTVSARRGLNPGGLWPEYPNVGHQLPVVLALDAAGKPMTVTDAGTYPATSADGQTTTYRYEWIFAKGAGTPAKFVVVGPRPLVVEVPFALENVPLP
jgi:hypothetical protein